MLQNQISLNEKLTKQLDAMRYKLDIKTKQYNSLKQKYNELDDVMSIDTTSVNLENDFAGDCNNQQDI